jgi:hypothetical protein
MPDKAEDVRRKALDQHLKAMFRNLEQRPVPAKLREVVDQLEAAKLPERRTRKV